jgi:hypothetical protein
LGVTALVLALTFDFGSFEFVTQAAAQSCTLPQVPDANGNCCNVSQLVEGPNGSSICGGTAGPTSKAVSAISNISSVAPVVGKYVVMKHPVIRPDATLGKLEPEFDVDRYIRDHPGEFGEFGNIGPLAPGAAHLGMYVTPAPSSWNSVGAFGGVAGVNGDAVAARDSQGLLAPGTQAPGYDGTVGGGGVYGSLDATRTLGLAPGQSMILTGSFGYSRGDIDYDRAPTAVTLDIFTGSLERNTYAFSGGFEYDAGSVYVRGGGGFNFGDGKLTNTAVGGNGDFDSDGGFVDLKLGNVFTLANTIRTGGGDKSLSAPGGHILGLDVSGHVGWSKGEDDGFTDSTGFTYGTETVEAGLIGARAKLFALIPDGSRIWSPFVAGSVNGAFAFDHTLVIPAQSTAVTVAATDKIRFSEDTTFWGIESGVELFCTGGVRGGLSGFYSASSDANAGGGRGYLAVAF